jgi:hypothetical protein
MLCSFVLRLFEEKGIKITYDWIENEIKRRQETGDRRQ